MQSQESTAAEFGLVYEGDALSENTMDVRDLAPSLLALGELFSRANSLLNGEDTTVSLKVQATKPGSFELLLVLAQVYQNTTQFLTSDLVTSAANLKSLIVGMPKPNAATLFSTVKKLKGQKPDVVHQDADGVTLRAGTVEVHVPTKVFKLLNDNEIKRLSQAVVEPLYKTGIDTIVIKDRGKVVESVNKQDAPSFTSANISEGPTTENIIPTLALKLISPTFDLRRSKWKLNDGGGSKWYLITDDKFLDEVREHKRRFGMGDYLICRVKTVQRITDEGLEIERTILRVLEQRKAGEQLPLTPPKD